jgi:hypothetical protein
MNDVSRMDVFIVIAVFVLITVSVSGFLMGVANAFDIETDLGYTVCNDAGAGRQTWEACTSSTFAGSVISLLGLVLGFLGARGVYRRLEDRARREHEEWRQRMIEERQARERDVTPR